MPSIIQSEIRGAGLISPAALQEYKALQVGQPLILTREPTNQKDPNALVARTVFVQPVGYVARQDAASLSPKMNGGELWVGYVTGKGAYAKWADVELVLVDNPLEQERFRVTARTYGIGERTLGSVLRGLYTNFGATPE